MNNKFLSVEVAMRFQHGHPLPLPVITTPKTVVWGFLPPLSGCVSSGKFSPLSNSEANLIGRIHPPGHSD